jgi:hypothetical protein
LRSDWAQLKLTTCITSIVITNSAKSRDKTSFSTKTNINQIVIKPIRQLNQMQQTPEQFKLSIEAKVLPIAQKLGTRNGFFEYWFNILPKCKSHKAAFDITNLLYFKIFKEDKYHSYASFKNQKSRYINSLRK